MKTLFVSQPYTGRTEKEIMEERELIKHCVESAYGEDFAVFDQYHQPKAPKNVSQKVWYLGNDLQAMSKADVVAFSSNWKKAKGCRIEHEVAMLYELKIFYMEEKG